ncbi:Phytochrome B [Hibiscus syriacus]|uniref:Phytochrome B n=1 Tax=Hibiscus syriacus TaxID=106335 RepID=A0A6A3CT21_HIBSY|nr:Phytochrome B [Hibiscus syriacus]
MKPKGKAIAQCNADAGLLAEFEQSGVSGEVLFNPLVCMIAIEEPIFRIISYCENCFELLVLHLDSKDKSKGSSQKSFYAILHRIDVGTVIDLEPARLEGPALSFTGAVHSQKLAVRAIARLQSLPGGDIGLLCDTVVEDVPKLTGSDRVMVYKFHYDDHGEVVSEIRRLDLEPYLGVNYPAADIPQAARFLFKQNRVRLICDCHANPVKVIQTNELQQPLCLANSTLRSPHGCHIQYMENMGSIASLVMAVVINDNDSKKLWGLVVCHHTSPRFVPFPLQYACKFLMQPFGMRLYKELQLASQLTEKKILKTQTLICDMLLRDAPFGILTQSPNIMDLVKCDGAAMYRNGKCWLLGVTPTESQVKDIAQWLLSSHGNSTGLSTDSLTCAGYPGAALLSDAVCGMATARIHSKNFLFWFRSHTMKKVKRGGGKHLLEEKDGGKMHPRSSFAAFAEVVRNKSLPWEIPEINAIHSLQLIMRDSFQDMEDSGSSDLVCGPKNETNIQGMDELSSVAYDMVRLIETATAPIFGVDTSGLINGWNAKIAELTCLQV